MLHVCLCFADFSGDYYKRALVTAASVFANTASPVCLHVVHDDTLDPEAARRFNALADGRGKQVQLHNAQKVPEDIERQMPRAINRGSLYRLMLPEILPCERVLYLDCDIVCECDVFEVLSQDIGDCFMGATRFGKERVPYFVKRQGLDASRYINSGVLLLNLDKLRRDMPNFIATLFNAIKEYDGKVTDQEALNIVFNKRPDAFFFMPEAYNFRIWQKDHAALPLSDYAGKILHFSGRKPWEQFSHASIHYWKYHSALFPDDKVFERIITLPSYEYAHLCAFMLRARFARRLVRRLYECREKGLFKTLFDRMTQGSGESRPGAKRR
ncbi:MAG: hypothetical protein LBH65_01450 [Desulfovibrio sp.]|jgi:lipopolysaccharide biosynthesis glycosyltransferase|nr:hypothetical protein [Desulfovibrio sp.]